MRLRFASKDLCTGLLIIGISMLGACAAEPEVAAEDELVAQLRDSFADPELRRDPDACIEGSLVTRACLREVAWKEAVERACRAFGGTLGRLAVSEACDAGGFHKAQFRCCPAAPPPPPPPNECVRELLGGETSCKPEATWKEHAVRYCAAKQLRLDNVSLDGRCGEGQFSHAKVTCCRPVPPPPPPPNECVRELLGGETSCKPEATWKEYATRLCAAKNLRLDNLAFDGRCGDGQFSHAKVVCCPADPPPPPMCETRLQGDVTSCKSEATWKEYAARDCASLGLTLRELGFNERCGDGQFRQAKYACCKL